MCTTEKNLHKLQIIQNSALRIILEADIDTSVKEMHKLLDLPNLTQRRNIHLAMECFNNVNNEESGLHNLFIPIAETNVRTIRQTERKLMNVPDICTNTGQKAFSYRGPNRWNKLLLNLCAIENKNNFKKEITRLTCLDEN